MEKINVLIVDDSAFMRKLISDFLTEDPRIEVIGTARNGVDALEKVKKLQPDVVTMDVEMPMMSGIEALKKIMETMPLPIVMLSSTTKEGAENTIFAMQYGAVDFIQKPSGPISIDLHNIKEEIVTKVVQASKANIKSLKISIKMEKIPTKTDNYSKIELRTTTNNLKKLLCIGTSTGGPRALQQVLTKFPSDYPAPILIVQHMPPGFTKSLANRLDTLCNIHVKEAEDGELIKIGTAYIAPGGYHLKVKKIGTTLAVQLDKNDIRNGHRPSVDVMFESVSELNDYEKIAVIMTGMGSDGSIGLKRLKETGQVISVAESKETSVVFGMPKAAIETNLVDKVVSLDKIAETILAFNK
ncbi:protein-glutamate methylesterase/protein-glutamine glutaminase [Ferdinandcohnia quinoae]|uniref:Protein-glutamate methylesterase/protein-glutamine glutaminase n=1 Tax=Fredinandcohnia quinoae TaxID=2918902 RepID=A0AAW5DZB0_9BACI|nr:chemotaxis response regulator protein-glutamate methylesterase [Fredinandcohnia sp. SECRCQ15]MCH1623764.1 chemotaxis response regulator protein-glutamate methylesterase [Fredinandcohnia sp. SECRCQ15]